MSFAEVSVEEVSVGVRVLVTGASGFLGRRVTTMLAEARHHVVALGRAPGSYRHPPGVHFATGDLTDRASLERAREQAPAIDTVVHLAGLVPKSSQEDVPAQMAEVNVGGTVKLLEVFGLTVRGLVYASTAEVYGLPQAPEPIGEDWPPDPPSYYAASKLAGEWFCRVFGQRHALRVSVLRLSVLYGSGDRIDRAVPNFVRDALSGKRIQLHGGEDLRDYLYVEDAAAACCLAAEQAAAGVFNIGSGIGTSIKDAAHAVLERAGSGAGIELLPPKKKASNIVMDITKAETVLGYRPKHVFPAMLEEQMSWAED